MNWQAIKSIYHSVLVRGNKIEYFGEDKYRLTSFHSNGNKFEEREYKNGLLHGKIVGWRKDGTKYWEVEYEEGEFARDIS